MKCAIIFLMAFCAFEIVFADLKSDLAKLKTDSLNKVQTIERSTQNDFEARLAAGRKKNKNVDPCRGPAISALRAAVSKRQQEIQLCIDTATKSNNFQPAPACCNQAVTALQKEVQSIVSTLQICIDKQR